MQGNAEILVKSTAYHVVLFFGLGLLGAYLAVFYLSSVEWFLLFSSALLVIGAVAHWIGSKQGLRVQLAGVWSAGIVAVVHSFGEGNGLFSIETVSILVGVGLASEMLWKGIRSLNVTPDPGGGPIISSPDFDPSRRRW